MTDQNPGVTPPPYTAAAPAPYGAPASGPVPGRTMGIVAFILSFFANVIALILGIVALVQSKKAGRGNGWALAAIIISSISIIIGIIVFFSIILPSLNAATTCLNDPTGIVTVWGVQVPCSEITR